MATRDIHPKLDLYCVHVLLILGSLEKAVHILGVLDVAMELIPPRLIKKAIVSYSYSSSQPVSVSRRSAHSRAAVLHTLHRGQIETRTCPYFINFNTLYPLPLPQLRESSVLIPLIFPPDHPRPPPPMPQPSPFPPPGQFPPFTTTAALPAPPASSQPPHTFPESVTLQYTTQTHSDFVECKSPLNQTPPPLLPPPPRCTTIYCPTSTVEASP